MSFEAEYPNAFAHFTTADGFMKGSGQPDECLQCDEPATWFHKALGFYFCSRECYELYQAAERRRQAGQASAQIQHRVHSVNLLAATLDAGFRCWLDWRRGDWTNYDS